ncbi:neural cell adhesion molecule 1-like isoform X3 [Penaeus chinensis]|uniref:neural cell adhesion molecule 1-like isoform X3 n=1 Tax=Penaeus chinensis TaxID=139456 RepID=UPI001FB75B0B|nr:neural cell adhesion molecule 1-like isoform X3 [Penaeus chinensis]
MARQGNFLVVLQLIAVVVGTSAPLPKTKVRSGLENSPLTEVHAVEASRVLLPCEVKPPVPSDDTILVLFYRGSIGTPIYSIDGRNSPVRQSPHWKDEAALGSRAYFDLTKHPPGLVLDPVEALDEDEYVCRVDFRSSPTRNVRVKLHVVVPPTGIRLMNEANVDVSGVIGPYPVGATVTLKCQVVGGHPRPIVTWRSDGILLDDVSEGLGPDDTVNTLVLESLTRNDLYRVLTCQTANSNLTVPLAAAVTLDMSFPPLDVRILGSRNNPFSAGERYELVCESSGSRPSAKITWWKNGMLMTDARIQVFQEGNVSRSTLYLTPSPADNTVYISCRAENQQVPASGLEDVIKLDVHYSPRLSLLAGQNLDMDDIKEGDDVYFECNIVANPKVYKVQWFHNGDEITHNVSAGVILSNQSLVLQQVTKRSSGQYTCTAANLHGSSGSNAVQLSVKSSPDPVNNCTVENVSSTGAAVRCQAGWDGGLAQTFTLSVSHARAHTRGQDKKNEAPRVLANTSTSPRPEFTLTGLQAGTEYVLTIMGVNKKGQSEPVRLKIFTLKDIAEKHTSPVGGTLAFTSLLAVILGVVASLLLMAVVIVLVVRSRCAHVHKPEVKMVYNKGVASPSRGSDDDLNSDDPNPDVIPINDVKLHFLPDHLVKTTQQVHQRKHPQQNPQQDPTATASGAEPSPDPGPLPCHLEACADPQCHPLTDYDSFYINPGTLVRQKSATMAPVSDPMALMGCPLAASTPTAAKSPPSLYPHPAHEVPLTYHGPPPPPYTHDTQRVAPLYTPHTLATAPSPSSFVCDTSFVPIPTSHPQDFRSVNIPSSYASDISSLTPAAYPQYTLSLGRKGTLAMEGVVPSCIAGVPAPPHHGSTYSVVPKPEREWMRPHALALPPWDDTGREREPSPAHRESSV